MNMLSYSFILFFPIVTIVYFLLPFRYRKFWLLVSNYYFYIQSGFPITFLIIATLITYIGGYIIGKIDKHKKAMFLIFMAMNLSLLIFFKYFDFLLLNFNSLLNYLNISNSINLQFNLIIPFGLSFYIFQSCTYLGDVYRGKIDIEKNFVKYALFVSFFPCIASGPIQKSRDLIHQFDLKVNFEYERVKKGLLLITYGFFVKLIVANNLASIVNLVFSDYANYSGLCCLIAAVCFSFQIYCDFSSYSDIAIGTAKVLGFELKSNFNRPYLSTNLAMFWKNWHMTLNSWFVEYVYIPLGGNRKGNIRKYINILVVFFLRGLWHGASWHFVLWGVINGLMQIFGEITKNLKSKLYKFIGIKESLPFIRGIKIITTFVLVTITWVFFRMASVMASIDFIKKMIFDNSFNLMNEQVLNMFGNNIYYVLLLVVSVGMFLLVQVLRSKSSSFEKFNKLPRIMKNIVYSFLVIVISFSLMSSNSKVNTSFIYFEF
ncbi:MAG: MBOAT family O-acyltransferase [Bacilli bacterium]